jgi:hypothetical protein
VSQIFLPFLPFSGSKPLAIQSSPHWFPGIMFELIVGPQYCTSKHRVISSSRQLEPLQVEAAHLQVSQDLCVPLFQGVTSIVPLNDLP